MSTPAPAHSIEVIRRPSRTSRLTHAIFDFDGTLSWLRHGWPRIMAGVFDEHLVTLPGESRAQLDELVLGEILALNGKPTLFQIIRLTEIVKERSGAELDPETMRLEYQSRLGERLLSRIAKVRDGAASQDDYLILGVRRVLDLLAGRNVKLFILSGTVEDKVREEAALLGVADFFEGRITGSPADAPLSFSKQDFIHRIAADELQHGEQLVSFGDGRVELLHTREIGGTCVGVASNEDDHDGGEVDPWKRRQLIDAGADLVIADYRDADALMELLFNP